MSLVWIVGKYSKEGMPTRNTGKWSILNSFRNCMNKSIIKRCILISSRPSYLPTTGIDLGLRLSLWLKAVRIFPRWLFKGESTVGPDGPKDNGLCATKVYCNVQIQTIEDKFLNLDYLWNRQVFIRSASGPFSSSCLHTCRLHPNVLEFEFWVIYM